MNVFMNYDIVFIVYIYILLLWDRVNGIFSLFLGIYGILNMKDVIEFIVIFLMLIYNL